MRTHSVEGKRGQRAARKGFFVRILEALHRARRREAIRVLRRYRHLIAGQAQIRPVKSPPELRSTDMSSENAHGNRPPVPGRKLRQETETRFA